jgi:hypothetical protein
VQKTLHRVTVAKDKLPATANQATQQNNSEATPSLKYTRVARIRRVAPPALKLQIDHIL